MDAPSNVDPVLESPTPTSTPANQLSIGDLHETSMAVLDRPCADLTDWSDGEDDGNEDADGSKQGVQAFAEKLEETVQCGCIFLSVWCFLYYLRPTVGTVVGVRENVHRRRILLAGFLLFCMVIGQLIIYISLTWAMLEGAVGYTDSNNTFCPGKDLHPDDSFDWKATPAQNLTIAATLIILLVNLSLDWMNTHIEFMHFMGSHGLEAKEPLQQMRCDLKKVVHHKKHEVIGAAPQAAARCRSRFTGTEVLRLVQQRYGTAVYIDFLSHVFLTVVIYVMTIFALFFMSTVGKMVTTIFALKFLEELDDEAKKAALRLTNMARVMYLQELANSSDHPQPIFVILWFQSKCRLSTPHSDAAIVGHTALGVQRTHVVN